MPKTMKKIWVKWLDHSTGDYGWTNKDALQDPEMLCETLGFLVSEDKTFITVAHSKYYERDVVCMTMSIVKACIVSRKYLK